MLKTRNYSDNIVRSEMACKLLRIRAEIISAQTDGYV